jgi:hypothetical protein
MSKDKNKRQEEQTNQPSIAMTLNQQDNRDKTRQTNRRKDKRQEQKTRRKD